MKNEFEKIIEKNEKYKELLFCRGYLITESKMNLNEYPFYDNWNCTKIGQYYFYYHKWQKLYYCGKEGYSIVLIGNAYNPFTIKIKEDDIIKDLLNEYLKDENRFFDKLSEITGIFSLFILNDEKFICMQDACGMEPIYYGRINSKIYLTSHAQLVADIENLEMDDFIKKYINKNFYKIGIRQLCGLNSAYKELTMLSPNNYLDINTFKTTRFYPKRELSSITDIKNIEKIIVNSLDCCIKKWECSVSLTGGVDSKMTLSGLNGHKDLNYFSFISSKAEEKDAKAAHEICANLGIKHNIYNIPKKEEIKDFDFLKNIINHNTSDILKLEDNDYCKIIKLYLDNNITMEIKSHISEIGRAFYYKKIGKRRFREHLTPREMSNLAKRNFFNRIILAKMDESFNEFIRLSNFSNFPKGYDETDMFYWENRMSAWASLVKQSFDISHDTIIIYNNRKLLDNFLRFPLEDRIKDIPQKQITRDLNPEIDKLNIYNENKMEGKKRIALERVFFDINSNLPF